MQSRLKLQNKIEDFKSTVSYLLAILAPTLLDFLQNQFRDGKIKRLKAD